MSYEQPEDAELAQSIITFPRLVTLDNFGSFLADPYLALLHHKLGDGWQPTRLDLYRNREGDVISAVLRIDHPNGSKEVRPLRARDQGYRFLEMKALDAPRPVFGLDLLAQRAGSPVIVVEGEKAAVAGRERFPEHVVLTWSGGTPGVDKADWRPLAGRDVVIWPDNDDAGRKAADKLGAILHDVGAASVRLVQVPTWFPKKWDLADADPDAPDE